MKELQSNEEKKAKIYSLLLRHLKIILPAISLALVTVITTKFGIIDGIFWFLNLSIPLFCAIIFAWLFYPLRLRIEKFGVNKIIATLIITAITIGSIIIIVLIALPILVNEVSVLGQKTYNTFNNISIEEFLKNVTNTINNIGINIDEKRITDELYNFTNSTVLWLRDFSKDAPLYLLTSISKLTSSIMAIFLGFSMSVFLLMDFERFSSFIPLAFKRKNREDGKILLHKMNEVARGYVVGTLIDGFIIFIMSTISLMIAGVPGFFILGVICGVTNLIPYVGPFIGAVPVVIVALFVDIKLAIISALIILVIQQIDGNVIKPILLGKTTKLHPVFIIFGLVIGGAVAGLLGMLVVTPIIAMIKVVLEHYDQKFDFLDRQEKVKKNDI